MELVQRYFLPKFGKSKIKAQDDKLIIEHKNITGQYTREFLYSEIDPNYIKGKSGDNGWSYMGVFFVIFSIIVSLSFKTFNTFHLKFTIPIFLLLCAVVCFLMLLVKREWISFCSKNGNFAFVIIRPNSPKNKDIVDFLISRIREADNI